MEGPAEALSIWLFASRTAGAQGTLFRQRVVTFCQVSVIKILSLSNALYISLNEVE